MISILRARQEELGLSALFAVALAALILAGCGSMSNTSSSPPDPSYPYTPGTVPGNTSGTTPTNPINGLPLSPVIEKQLSTEMFQMYGRLPVGNHPAHVCLPASRKLKIRVVPLGNSTPINPPFPYGYSPVAADGKTAVYPLPGNYQKLRVRLSIPGTAASWDFQSDINKASVVGDFSPYLKYIGQSSFSGYQTISTPEYDPSKPLTLGATPWDGLCTYQEKTASKCGDVSYSLRQSEVAGCPYGYQKILITNIVSDYPCTNDTYNWCGGNAMQTVLDYQYWDIKIQAVTEATVDFSN